MIIEGCDGKIVRATESGCTQHRHCPERHFIGMAEDRRRKLPAAGEQFIHRTLTIRGMAVVRSYDVAAVDVKTSFSDGVAQPVSPLIPHVVVTLARHASVEDADIAMT